MIYLNLDYIKQQVPSEILSLTSADNIDISDDETINEIVDDVESEIDSYLITASYDLDVIHANPPYLLRRIALKMFKYYLYSRKDVEKTLIDQLGADFGDARNTLNKIADGTLVLSGLDKVSLTTMESDYETITTSERYSDGSYFNNYTNI